MVFFFSSRRRHTRLQGDWSSDVCSSDLEIAFETRQTADGGIERRAAGEGHRHNRLVFTTGIEIGRASCRERVESSGGAGGVNKNIRRVRRSSGTNRTSARSGRGG